MLVFLYNNDNEIIMKTIEYPESISDKTDGETHINVYSKGQTWLGRELSNFAHRPFNHPEHGLFASVEGYWYWLSRRDDDLRHMYGFKAKNYGKDLPVIHTYPEAKFRELICQAIDAKIKKHLDIRLALAESSLELTHYYVTKWNKGAVKMAPNSLWLLAHIEQIRHALNPDADMSNTVRMREQSEQAEKRDDHQIGLF